MAFGLFVWRPDQQWHIINHDLWPTVFSDRGQTSSRCLKCELQVNTMTAEDEKKKSCVARTETSSPTDVMSDKSVVTPICVKDLPERYSASLVQCAGPFGERVFTERKMILNCCIKTVVERVLCLVCAC